MPTSEAPFILEMNQQVTQLDSAVARYSELRRFLRILLRNPITLLGLFIILLTTVTAIFAEPLAPYSPNEIHSHARLTSPNTEFFLGTDHLGRDVLSRLIHGARVSLVVGVISTLISAFVGTLIGGIAGYWGGWLDEILMRVMDTLMAFPAIVLAVTLVALVGPSFQNLIYIIGIIRVPHFARLCRGSTLSLKEQEFVLASRSLGQSDLRILLRHILPNTVTPIIVLTSLSIGTAIITESALSFLGLGIRPPQSSWGTMLKSGQEYMLITPWPAIFTGIAISITVLGYNIFGDGLRDAVDPKERR